MLIEQLTREAETHVHTHVHTHTHLFVADRRTHRAHGLFHEGEPQRHFLAVVPIVASVHISRFAVVADPRKFQPKQTPTPIGTHCRGPSFVELLLYETAPCQMPLGTQDRNYRLIITMQCGRGSRCTSSPRNRLKQMHTVFRT